MPKLCSEEKNNPSYFELLPSPVNYSNSSNSNSFEYTEAQKEKWQQITIKLKSGLYEISSLGKNGLVLCRAPVDEIKKLIELIESFISNKLEQISFEPTEPSFELNFRRSINNGIIVELWIDAGNESSGFYTWDAMGLRFFTNTDKLKDFIKELALEFSFEN